MANIMLRRSSRPREVIEFEIDHEDKEDQLNESSQQEVVEQPTSIHSTRSRAHKKRKIELDEQSMKSQVDTFNMKTMKKGSLEKMKEIPLDVLFEVSKLLHPFIGLLDRISQIFSKLQPSDLLNLARSTKRLRTILMRKNTITIWRRARANTEGLPPRPDDLTEPQYAELVFGQHCYVCAVHRRPNLPSDRVKFCGRVGDKNRMSFRTRIRTCPLCAFQETKYDFFSRHFTTF